MERVVLKGTIVSCDAAAFQQTQFNGQTNLKHWQGDLSANIMRKMLPGPGEGKKLRWVPAARQA